MTIVKRATARSERGETLDIDLEDRGVGWAVAGTIGLVMGVLAAVLVRKKKKQKGDLICQ